jgi:L-ascorbate metabolism protein UlaG (beta-lactamase superfamily)
MNSIIYQEVNCMDAREFVKHIHWLGHDSFRIEAEGLIIYIDPYRLPSKDLPKADLILITHHHGDHCSPEDVARIQTDKTVIVTVAEAATKLTGQVIQVKPNETVQVKGVTVQAVPAYNTNKFRSPGNPFHPAHLNLVGFVLTLEGLRVYHAGDSDHIPEMAQTHADIALLPVSGTYVMTVEEAAQAAADIRPQIAIPMHVGADIGSLDMAEKFKSLCPLPVVVLPLER